MKLSLFKVAIVSQLLQLAAAFPSGAGGCAGGQAAVNGSHVWQNKSIVTGELDAQGYVLNIGDTALTPGGSIGLSTGVDYLISVNATADRFRGVLMRFQAPPGIDTTAAILPGVFTQVAQVCVAPIVGITHILGRLPKTATTGTLRLDEPATVILDITVVKLNEPFRSTYFYSQYTAEFRDATPTAPTVPAPTPPAPTVPIPSPTSAPVPAPVAPVASPTSAPVVTPTVPDPSPTSAPVPAPVAPVAPVAGPTTAPVVTPTVPVTPTTAPVPVPATPTAAPVDTPTMAPVTTAPTAPTAPTSASPTAAPVVTPTAPVVPPAPSAAPVVTPTTATPSAMPVPAPTAPVPVAENVTGVMSTFTNVTVDNGTQIAAWIATTEAWFDASYNTANAMRGRRLAKDPSTLGIKDMKTTLFNVDPVGNADGSVTFTYDQGLEYVQTDAPVPAPSVITTPYEYPPTLAQYESDLMMIPGFENVGPVAVPVVPAAPTSAPSVAPSPPAPSGDSGLSGGAIAGIVIGVLAGVALLGGAYYYFNVYKKDGSAGAAGGKKKEAVMQVEAPSGTLGLIFYSHEPVVRALKESSVMKGQLRPGDKITSVDGVDTKSMTSAQLSKLLKDKAGNDTRNITIARPAIEETVDVEVPSGSLGIIFEKHEPKVRHVKEGSVVTGKIFKGDLVTAVDDEPTKTMTASEISKLLKSKAGNASRKLTIARMMQEEVLEFEAPPGALGVVFDKTDPSVRSLKDSSSVSGSVKPGDKIVAVDDEQVESMSSSEVSKLLKSKSESTRRVSVKRSTPVYDTPAEDA